MYHKASGEGEPLILLHGSYMSIPLMGDLVPELTRSRKVYALEFQSHGRTADIDQPITYQNLADDVAAFINAIGLGSADVVGYSMGTGTALQLAVWHPGKVRRLVSRSAVVDTAGWQPEFRRFIPLMSPEILSNSPVEERYRRTARDPDAFPVVARKLIALDREEFDWGLDIAKLDIPILLIAGDADVTTLEHTVKVFRHLGGGGMGDMGEPMPSVKLVVLPASSHAAIIGQVELLRMLIEPFLEDQ